MNDTSVKTGAIIESSRIFESASGSNTVVVFEFPSFSPTVGSVYIHMKSIVTLSCSVHRAKIPIITLGTNAVQGFALGNKTVAGSIIKTLTYDDDLAKVVNKFAEDSLKDKRSKLVKDDPSYKIYTSNSQYNLTHKEFDSIMRDDLIPFNIYCYSFSEYASAAPSPRCLMNVIYGCTIINEGQVQSIENLVTENTFSFIAKYAVLGQTPETVFNTYPTETTTKSGSDLIRNRKKN